MENSRILNHSRLSGVSKGARFGAISGAVLTIVIQGLCLLLGHGGERSLASFLMLPWFAILIPTWALYKVLGLPWKVGGVYEMPWYIFLSMIVVNSVLLGLLGSVLGFLMKRRKPEGSAQRTKVHGLIPPPIKR
jgi:hypothetical protein